MRVRRAIAEDAEALRQIYNREVTTSVATFDLVPRSLEEQQRWIEARSGAHAVLVAESDDGEVMGFASLSPFRDRPAYATSVESSVYIHPDHRGEGVGRKLLAELIEVASQHGFHTVLARIVQGHASSIGLHESCGFELVGTERQVGRKFGRWLDVVVLQRML